MPETTKTKRLPPLYKSNIQRRERSYSASDGTKVTLHECNVNLTVPPQATADAILRAQTDGLGVAARAARPDDTAVNCNLWTANAV